MQIPKAVISSPSVTPVTTAISMISTASRWPGGLGHQLMLTSSGVATNDVPAQRWWTTGEAGEFDFVQSQFGSFCWDMQKLDSRFFGIGPPEASVMDPQQRVLLEIGYEALHGAGERRKPLAGRPVAVHIGIDHLDWQSMQQRVRYTGSLRDVSVYAGSGEHGNMASGRLAYVLNLRGPSITFNTACSSTLVASHVGAQFLRSGECCNVLAAGTKALLLPFALAGLYAPDGRCKSFDARANGYCRAEAVGAAFFSRDEAALIVSGSAVQAGGRSASLTAPNGSAMSGVIRSGLSQ
eukprot:4103310-Prymnesium_polylepis.1